MEGLDLAFLSFFPAWPHVRHTIDSGQTKVWQVFFEHLCSRHHSKHWGCNSEQNLCPDEAYIQVRAIYNKEIKYNVRGSAIILNRLVKERLIVKLLWAKTSEMWVSDRNMTMGTSFPCRKQVRTKNPRQYNKLGILKVQQEVWWRWRGIARTRVTEGKVRKVKRSICGEWIFSGGG